LIAAKRPPTATTLAQLATAFGVDVCELLCDAKDDGGGKAAGKKTTRGKK
jgi:hypothetical protein